MHRLQRISKEKSELRLQLGEEETDGSEQKVENRMSIISRDVSFQIVQLSLIITELLYCVHSQPVSCCLVFPIF